MKQVLIALFCPLLTGSVVLGQDWKSKYDSVSKTASEGFFIVYKNGKSGFADEKTGKETVSPKYDRVTPFADGLAVAEKKITYSDYNSGIINKSGKEVVPLVYGSIYIGKGFIVADLNGKSGLLDKTGKKLTPLKYSYIGRINDGLVQVGLDGKYGIADKTGKELTAIKYDYILSLSKGVAIAEREEKYYTVTKTGKETLLNYEKVGFENFGLMLVQKNKKYGFINAIGAEVIPLKYDNAWDFSSYSQTGYLSNVRLGTRSGFIDTTGKEVIPLKYDWAGLFREGLAAVRMNGPSGGAAYDNKWGYVDSAGNLVIQMNYNEAGNFSEGLAPVSKKTGSWGYIDKTGKEVFSFEFQHTKEFSEGLAAVKKNGKYGFIDKYGKEVIPCKFESVITGFRNGRAFVRLDGSNININKKGEKS